jgi:quinol-cytochrome oxidoreductase complex cytochrome b subunit
MWYFGPPGWPSRWVWGAAAVVSAVLLVLYGLTGSAIPAVIAFLVVLVLAARATTARFRGMGDLGQPPNQDDER